MALTSCPDCDRDVSDRALLCPGCGRPLDPTPRGDSDPVEPVRMGRETPAQRRAGIVGAVGFLSTLLSHLIRTLNTDAAIVLLLLAVPCLWVAFANMKVLAASKPLIRFGGGLLLAVITVDVVGIELFPLLDRLTRSFAK
jgi:hypothetical protein